MNNSDDVNFTDDYKPKEDAYVELYNGKFVDVTNSNFFNYDAKLIVKGGRIVAMPDVHGQVSDIKPDFFVDLKGKTVLPGLCNTHCHTTHAMPSLIPDLKGVKLLKVNAEKQIEKNLTECLLHGVTIIRDAWAADLRMARVLRERINNNEIIGPRIMQEA